MKILSYEVLEDGPLAEGKFLRLRRLRLCLLRADGSRTQEGTYEFVERPRGPDAVVVALHARDPEGGTKVLLRDGLRVPLQFGRAELGAALLRPFAEVVAGIAELGEDSEAQLQERAAEEIFEEAGVRVSPSRVRRLGAPSFPTAGMCPELFNFFSCELSDQEAKAAHAGEGDGSPFEEGASVRWMPLPAALRACDEGRVQDMKTELALRRLSARLGEGPLR